MLEFGLLVLVVGGIAFLVLRNREQSEVMARPAIQAEGTTIVRVDLTFDNVFRLVAQVTGASLILGFVLGIVGWVLWRVVTP